MPAVLRAYAGKRLGNACLIGEIGLDRGKIGIAARHVEPDHGIAILQRGSQRAADIASSAGNQTIGLSVMGIPGPIGKSGG